MISKARKLQLLDRSIAHVEAGANPDGTLPLCYTIMCKECPVPEIFDSCGFFVGSNEMIVGLGFARAFVETEQ